MNARRRDELTHRAIGLSLQSMSVVDEGLALNQCHFYIEKTTQDYVPFYINGCTKDAISILENIAKIAWDWEAFVTSSTATIPINEQKLFVAPGFVSAQSGRLTWFVFKRSQGGPVLAFLEAALVRAEALRVTPHMLRRGYAMIYHYQYEHGTLLGLSQKMGHNDLASTLHYVHDESSVELGSTGAAIWTTGRRLIESAHEDHHSMLAKDVEEVGIEKLELHVSDVLNGQKNFSGGFARLVNRFHLRLGASVSYASLDRERKGEELARVILKRGHMPHPLKYTTCMAGSNSKLARCVKEEGKDVLREEASPATCSQCAYSITVASHVRALEHEEQAISERLRSSEPESLIAKRETVELNEIRRIIELHTSRLSLIND